MYNIVVVEVVHGVKNLLDSLRSILLRELASLADAVKEFTSCRKLGDDVELILLITNC